MNNGQQVVAAVDISYEERHGFSILKGSRGVVVRQSEHDGTVVVQWEECGRCIKTDPLSLSVVT